MLPKQNELKIQNKIPKDCLPKHSGVIFGEKIFLKKSGNFFKEIGRAATCSVCLHFLAYPDSVWVKDENHYEMEKNISNLIIGVIPVLGEMGMGYYFKKLDMGMLKLLSFNEANFKEA